MFGKRKNENDVNETYSNTASTSSLRDSLQASKTDVDALRLTECVTAPGFIPLGLAHSSYSPASMCESFTTSLSITHFDGLLEAYKDLATAVMNVLEPEAAVARLTNMLENIKCPTDDCRACPYHIPGNVEHCDKNRFLAEYLVYKGFIKVNRPKQEEQEEK
jgi:hypothetical protein